MSQYTYRAIFEIRDDNRPASALVAEAAGALDSMARGDGARIVGEATWTVSGLRLVAEAPAVPAAPGPVDRNADIVRLSGLRWSDGQIAAVVGCSRSTVRKVRVTAGIAASHPFGPGAAA